MLLALTQPLRPRDGSASREAKGIYMTPLDAVTTSLQVLSSWLMSILAFLALLVSAIVCLVWVEVFFDRGEVSQSYTVKSSSSGESKS
jgi:hypothetical protein